jgi:signal transduction histidine kinase
MEAFTYTVAHDLRAPLRAMHGFSQYLTEEYPGKILDEEGMNALRRIMDGSRRMDALIQDLLAFSQLGREIVTLERVDLAPLVETVVKELVNGQAGDADLKVERPLPAVQGNRTILSQVLTNLISNAVKFVAPGVRPAIRIRSEVRGAGHRLWVEDNGIGISPEYHVRIFKVFERLNRAEDYAGTGIGLAIAARAMERMGGKIGVESEAGRGSRFWIELPAPKEAA